MQAVDPNASSYNAADTVVFCACGHPCVASCYPLRSKRGDIEPFPTLYWLVCPNLSRQLSHLERDGAIHEIESALCRSASMQEELNAQHEQYIESRWRRLAESDKRLIADRGWTDALRERGIGGARNRAAVKCLHAHYAHHLAAENVIGRWIDDHYPIATCAAALQE